MRYVVSALALTLMIGAVQTGALVAQDPPAEPVDSAAIAEARAAAEAWLELMDSDRYIESWEEAGEVFQDAMTAEEWETQATSVRGQIGSVENRTFDAAEPATDPPNAPPGEYVAMSYNSTFSTLGPAVESVITMQQPDGSWRVVGYQVQPDTSGIM